MYIYILKIFKKKSYIGFSNITYNIQNVQISFNIK